MDDQWDKLIHKASTLIENREKYQRILGELAFKIAEEFGFSKLDDFSRDLREAYGLSISASSLKNYKWVHEKTHSLNFPKDISYRTLQYIASSGRPEYWANKIKNEGLSSPEVYRLIRIEKGLDKKKVVKMNICPACGFEFLED
jgi:hypothetical protein